MYYQVGSGVSFKRACKRYFAVANETNGAGVKETNGAGVKGSDAIGGTLTGLMGVAIATLLFSILGCIPTAAIFKKIVMPQRSRRSAANPAFAVEMHGKA